jgi:hypothetical protein
MFAKKLRGTRSVLWLALLSMFVGLALLPPACFAQDVQVTMFGPKQYLRTTASVDVFTDNFLGVQGNGTVIIQNGDGNGKNLVSDLMIVINGVPLADWSALMQPGYKLEAPILMDQNNSVLVIILGKAGSYLTIQAQAEITPDATTTQVIGIAGGTASVQNHLGDTFTLTIPPLALDQDTPISISALPNALPSPIANNLYPGAVLGPEGVQFSLPVSVDVTSHNPVDNPGAATLYWVEDSAHVLPLANQSAAHGQIYHFSPPVAWGQPSCGDMQARGEWWWDEPQQTPQNLIDNYNGVISLLPTAQSLGCSRSVTNFLLGIAQEIALETGDTLRSEPAPEYMPCGPYTNLMKRWEAMVADAMARVTGNTPINLKIIGWYTEWIKEIKARECTFSVAPSLSLFVGETSQQGITATLINPVGEQKSCSLIDWYNSNPTAVAIGNIGNVCSPTGVARGVSSVSANCDGLASSNEAVVSVCSLSGTYQGGYSGQTIGCVLRAPDGGCLKRGPKSISGTIAIPFTQNGTSVSAVIMGYTFTGTNKNGNVILGAMVPCKSGTSTCPAGLNGKLSSDCSTFSGSFYDDRPRTITGTFSLTFVSP